ncbi:LysE/ArgO family amino acid transporter [Deinococcus pimensis]|uniref:LysE/ArgO family amino acid transporter n=1 Tax=Deinococcus pimensis TaxID=309888 RepID=UPI0004807EA2|nr:LysE family transporter [Deinococcus pimensis]
MGAALEGLLVGLSLIVAIGAQNAFVLRAGLRRSHPGVVALVSTLGDVTLILVGALGVGAALSSNAVLSAVARCGGAAFLVWFGARSLRSALRPPDTSALSGTGGAAPVTARSAAMSALGFSLLNPHVYLDTVVLLGTVAARHAGPSRAWFALGACAASAAWFFALAYGAAALAPILRGPRVWRTVDVLVALVVWGVALRLVLE